MGEFERFLFFDKKTQNFGRVTAPPISMFFPTLPSFRPKSSKSSFFELFLQKNSKPKIAKKFKKFILELFSKKFWYQNCKKVQKVQKMNFLNFFDSYRKYAAKSMKNKAGDRKSSKSSKNELFELFSYLTKFSPKKF